MLASCAQLLALARLPSALGAVPDVSVAVVEVVSVPDVSVAVVEVVSVPDVSVAVVEVVSVEVVTVAVVSVAVVSAVVVASVVATAAAIVVVLVFFFPQPAAENTSARAMTSETIEVACRFMLGSLCGYAPEPTVCFGGRRASWNGCVPELC